VKASLRDWLFSIPTVIAFGLTLAVFDIAGRVALLFGMRPFEWTMAALQRTLLSVFAISGVRFDVEGLDRFDASGGYIFISNHQSIYDVPIFGGILTRNFPKYVAKRSLARGIPSISLNLRRGGNALIDRGERAEAMATIKRMAAECQNRDVSAVIFPEGTRSRDGSLGEYRVGGVAALMEGAPELEIVPTVSDGSWRVFSHNMFPVPFGTQVKVAFGEPILRTEDEDPGAVVERCLAWSSETLARWNEDGGTNP
jgi:1-acyl-sn-glycerol-3-phosphate acyltransferase